MRIQVPKKQLGDSLASVERIIPNRSSNPGLSLVRVAIAEEGVTFTGSNMDIDIRAFVPADTEGEGEVALPAHVFGQVIRSLPGELVEMEVNEQELDVRSGNYATKLQLAELASVPEVSFPAEFQGLFAAERLAKALAHVRYAAAVAEYQAIFRGVKVEFNDKKLRAVATDGFRLAYYHLEEATGLEGDVVIPARSVDELVRLLGAGEAKLELITDSAGSYTQLSLENGRYTLNLKLMEGSFPDYERIIPAQFPVSVTLDAKVLAEAVSRVAVMADKSANNRVDLFIKDGDLQITAEGSYGRSQETLQVSQEGSESQIALAYNAKYLVDALQPVDAELRLSFSGPTSPSVLASLKDPSYLAMVVPLRTT